MDGKQIIHLAADLAAGTITTNAIREQFGEGVLTSVLAIAGGGLAGFAIHSAIDMIDDHTGIVSDLGSVVDDVIDTFKFW